MNHEPTVENYMTKNELYEEFGRHPRTITKDITKAISRGDQELLPLAQLRTKNEEVIEGTDATSMTWKALSDQGENPIWYFLPEFVEIVRKRNSKKPSPRRITPEPKETSKEENVDAGERNSANLNSENLEEGMRPALPDNFEVRAIVLEHLRFQSLKHETENKDLMNRMLKLVEVNQQLQGQTNMLFNQFQANLQEGAIPAVSVTKSKTPASENEPKQEAVEPVIVVEEKVVAQSKAKPTTKKTASQKTKKSVKKRKSNSGTQKKAANQNAKAKKKSKPSEEPKKPGGFLGRLFGTSNK